MHRAAKHGRASIIPALIPEAGVNTQDLTGSKWTPLHYAASSRKVECCKSLLAAGADKSLVDAHGRTALDIASERSFLDIVSILNV